MAVTIPVDLDVDSSELTQGFSQMSKSMSNVGKKSGQGFTKGFGSAAAGLGAIARRVIAPIAAVASVGAGVSFFKGAIAEASDLEESANAVQVSFGDAADDILKLGKTSATSFGLSESEFRGFATQFSAFSKTIAGADGDVSGTFESIIGRATDFASVMNLEVGQAAQIFQSGLAGETEPLRKFGIDLSAAAVEAFAYSNGIAKSGEELTEAQKQQARYGALMEQTAQTQGDFANTSDGLANQQRILSSNWKNLQATLGRAFLPALSSVVQVINSKMGPAMEYIGELAPKISSAVEGFLGGGGGGFGFEIDPATLERFQGLISELIPQVQAFAGTIRDQVVAVFNNLKPVLDAIVREGFPLLVSAWQQIMPIASQLGALIVKISDILGVILPPVIKVLAPLFKGAFGIIGAVVGTVIGVISGYIDLLVAAFTGDIPGSLNALKAIWNSIWGGIKGVFSATIGQIEGVVVSFFPSMEGKFDEGFALVVQIVKDAWKNIVAGVTNGVNTVIATVQRFVTGTVRTLRNGWNTAVTTVRNAVNNLRNTVVATFNNIVSAVVSRVNSIRSRVTSTFASMVSAVSSRVRGMRDAAVDAFNGLLGFVRGIPGRIRSAIGSIGDILYNAGRSVIEGFARGIREAIGKATGAVSSAMGAVRRLIPSSPAKEGPFSGKGWTLYGGESTVEAFAEGIARASGSAVEAARSAMSDAAGAFGVGTGSASLARPRVDRTSPATTAAADSGPGDLTINSNYYGPTTGAERAREIDWTLRYATKARSFAGRTAVA